MYKAISAALLIGGAALIFFGVQASNSVGSDFSRLFTGNPTDKTIWLLVGGAVLCVVGLTGILRGKN